MVNKDLNIEKFLDALNIRDFFYFEEDNLLAEENSFGHKAGASPTLTGRDI